MSGWVLKGLKTGIRTTLYPKVTETAPGVSPGRPEGGGIAGNKKPAAAACPVDAIAVRNKQVSVDYDKCILCARCLPPAGTILDKPAAGYEWAYEIPRDGVAAGGVAKTCSHSLHIKVVDGGACNACLSEVSQLTKPYYDMHRLGFFITPTPRDADLLLVVGPVTEHMKLPLKKAFEAMPEPKTVMAVGTCALSGGIFGPGFAAGGGVREFLPVDIAVPGCPPPPLAIIHGLLMAVGRKDPVPSSTSPGPGSGREAEK
ncbi:hypothetical protein MNBD_DELTA04-1133 [hydrothermal vent metagenome]|uniref:NADH:ubiquinone oxidoreductase-like 20kDa subunit domain-containing protein n=1 Tax=hydrothermal vent metagenome TaxID=652676 RepID=A0A3B0W3R8_9ZZZZ